MNAQSLILNLQFQEIINLWKEFCSLHTELYEQTCEEYKYMISSDIELLEKTVDEKKLLIESINELDLQRQLLLAQINDSIKDNEINKASDLISYMKKNELTNFSEQLDGYNSLLISIVEKIQDQNKTNQIFLNRAIISLQELKQNFQGKKTFKTYNFRGTTDISANS